MTDVPDLLALLDADLDALRFRKSLPKIPDIPPTRETQAVDFIGGPGSPENPDPNSERSSEGNYGGHDEAPIPPRTHAYQERARARSPLSENTERTGVPYLSMGKGGRDSGVSGVSGEVQPDADLIALFEERAAIREFEAGFDRPMAQSLAIDDCLNELTGWSTDEVVRADALRTLRGAGIRQPQTFPTASDDPPF